MHTPASLNDPRTINGWAMFDWANSAFALVITTAIFPSYYASLSEEPVSLFNGYINLETLFSYAISAAYLLLALLTPLLSGIADASGRKLFFLRGFTLVGSLACMAMWFFQGLEQLELGTLLFMLGMIGFSGGLVFYNAFMPEIATKDRYDAVSARGFSFGYIGSVLLLLLCLTLIQKPELVGLPNSSAGVQRAVRTSFVLVGIWWLGFSQISFRRLPPDRPLRICSSYLKAGYREVLTTWRHARSFPRLTRFLAAFFCYSAGVHTVLYLASIFATLELNFSSGELIVVVLLLQLLAIGGAQLFAFLSNRLGNINSLLLMLGIWIMICLLAYFVSTKVFFYAIAGLVGLVMGGVQSLSRATYAKFIPGDTRDTTSYFSFYDLVEKFAIVLGTFSFGVINALTGGMRTSILFMSAFFVAGLLLLLSIRKLRPAVTPAI